VFYEEESRLLKQGGKASSRSFLNLAHTRKFMQTLMIAARCKDLLEESKTASIRELYYQLKHTLEGPKEENTFEDQTESDACVEDLERMMDVLREQLHLNADKSGTLHGNITIQDAGDTIDCSKQGMGGYAIPSNIERITIKSVDADYGLVIETSGMGDRLKEEKFDKKNNAILISTGGQASRGARRLVHRLAKEFDLPIYVFTDGDPYGYYIYNVIKCGSINLAYLSERLATPESRFIGMRMTDIDKYGLDKVTEKLKPQDEKRIQEELSYPWFNSKEWQEELKTMLKKKVRIEQQALAYKSLSFVADEYLPGKISEGDFLP
jgi:DNA topoisomerase-6 subunit A